MITKKQSMDALATHAGKQVRCHFDYRLEQGELPRQRSVRSNRMDDFEYDTGARRTLHTTEGEWYRSEYGNQWRLDDQLRDKLLEIDADLP
jgi:hypothetical protein